MLDPVLQIQLLGSISKMTVDIYLTLGIVGLLIGSIPLLWEIKLLQTTWDKIKSNQNYRILLFTLFNFILMIGLPLTYLGINKLIKIISEQIDKGNSGTVIAIGTLSGALIGGLIGIIGNLINSKTDKEINRADRLGDKLEKTQSTLIELQEKLIYIESELTTKHTYDKLEKFFREKLAVPEKFYDDISNKTNTLETLSTIYFPNLNNEIEIACRQSRHLPIHLNFLIISHTDNYHQGNTQLTEDTKRKKQDYISNSKITNQKIKQIKKMIEQESSNLKIKNFSNYEMINK